MSESPSIGLEPRAPKWIGGQSVALTLRRIGMPEFDITHAIFFAEPIDLGRHFACCVRSRHSVAVSCCVDSESFWRGARWRLADHKKQKGPQGPFLESGAFE